MQANHGDTDIDINTQEKHDRQRVAPPHENRESDFRYTNKDARSWVLLVAQTQRTERPKAMYILSICPTKTSKQSLLLLHLIGLELQKRRVQINQ